MKKKIISAVSVILIALIALSAFAGCEKEPEKDPLTEKFTAFLNEVYAAFNAEDFDKFMTYLELDETLEIETLGRLKGNIQYFSSKYTLENLIYTDLGEGIYLLTAQFVVDIEDYTNETKSKVREVDRFRVKPSGDSYVIIEIIEGEAEQVKDAA